MRPATTIFQRSTSLARQVGQHVFTSTTACSNPGATSSNTLWVGVPRPTSALFPGPCLSCQYPPLLPSRRFSGNNNRPPRDTSSQTPPPSSPPPTPSFEGLPSEAERRRPEISKRFSATMDDLQSAAFTAGKRLNDLTGYSGIETLKKSIEEQEAHVKASRQEVKAAKEAYQAAINRRSASQREVNELLQRKHAWSPADLERFTSLYRSDHANEQEEATAQQRLSKAEQVAEEAQTRLARSILTRYHEEQIWSDKIRRASTWGTWGLMGFNVVLFIIVQLGLEPWKRRRLVGGFEEKVREVIQEEGLRSALLRLEVTAEKVRGTIVDPESIIPNTELSETAEIVEVKADVAQPIAEEHVAMEDGQVFVESLDEQGVPTGPAGILAGVKGLIGLDPEAVNQNWKNLFSEQVIEVRRRDLTVVTVGSAAAGAIITSIIAIFANR